MTRIGWNKSSQGEGRPYAADLTPLEGLPNFASPLRGEFGIRLDRRLRQDFSGIMKGSL
jgi:hypothetical protein